MLKLLKLKCGEPYYVNLLFLFILRSLIKNDIKFISQKVYYSSSLYNIKDFKLLLLFSVILSKFLELVYIRAKFLYSLEGNSLLINGFNNKYNFSLFFSFYWDYLLIIYFYRFFKDNDFRFDLIHLSIYTVKKNEYLIINIVRDDEDLYLMMLNILNSVDIIMLKYNIRFNIFEIHYRQHLSK